MFRQYILTFFRELQIYGREQRVWKLVTDVWDTIHSKGKGKDKGTEYRTTGHEDQEGSRGLAIDFL